MAYKAVRVSVACFLYAVALYPKDTYPGVCQGIEGYARKLSDLVLVPVLQLTAEYLPVGKSLFLCLLSCKI